MKIQLLTIAIFLIGCNAHNRNAPLIPKDMTSMAERKNTLFAFVGEKISLNEILDDSVGMDAKYMAKYKILQRVYGLFPGDTIEFKVFDHYGTPVFSLYKNVLLFVSAYNGKYYHEKYQFFAVYPTKNHRWAATYSKYYDYKKIKPEKIVFEDSVSLPTRIINLDGDTVYPDYPMQYFNVVGGRAFPLYGNYLEELFEIKKNGVLKWRGLFGKGNENWEDSTIKTEMVPVSK
ncbi:hypothetical protein [Ferruginibacter sp.]